MGLFDTVTCEYPLPDPAHQHLEFQTKDLECLMDHYTITRDGRFVRHRPEARRASLGRDVEWPIHGDIHIYDVDPERADRLLEYRVRFTHGRVEWIRRVGERLPDTPPEELPPQELPVTTHVASPGLVPGLSGRRLTLDEYRRYLPEKIELIDGKIPGDEQLLLALLTSIGLRRAATLVGPELWQKAVDHGPSDAAPGA